MKIFATLARGSLLAYTALFFAFIYIPLALIAVYSFNVNPVNMMTWTGFTTDWYAQVLGFKTKISENAPLTVKAIKRITAEAMKDPGDRDVALCDRLVAHGQGTAPAAAA